MTALFPYGYKQSTKNRACFWDYDVADLYVERDAILGGTLFGSIPKRPSRTTITDFLLSALDFEFFAQPCSPFRVVTVFALWIASIARFSPLDILRSVTKIILMEPLF